MTTSTNTLQVVSRDLLERLHGWLTHIHHFRVTDMADLEAALKETPALGGEPEVLAHVQGDRTLQWLTDNWRSTPKGTELIDRASLTPYQAENERLRGDLSKYMARADDYASKMLGAQGERDQLKTRVAELESGIKWESERNALLLERVNELEGSSGTAEGAQS